jgi:hypothetical protein
MPILRRRPARNQSGVTASAVRRELRLFKRRTKRLIVELGRCGHITPAEARLAILVEPEPSSRERREAKKLECPECSCAFSGARLCPECGYFFAPKGKEVTTLAGELIEIGEHLEPEEQDRLSWFAELLGYACERGFKSGWASHKFREKHGDWPPRSWNSMPAARPSEATRRWIKSRTIAWLKSRQASA